MGNSILQHLVKAKSGLMLLEDFESQDFLTDQGWTLLNGAPKITTNAAFSLAHSFIMDLSYPLIQRSFTSNFQWSAGYFLDDATQTVTAFNPFMQWISVAAPATYGLGVHNPTSAANYTALIAGVPTATAVVRTTGWHKFEFIYNPGTITITLKIDGVVVYTAPFGGLNFTQVKVGARTFVGATAFGYFDLIQVTSGTDITFVQLPVDNAAFNGATATLYDAAGAVLVGPQTTNGTFTALATLAVAQQPFVGSLSATKPNGSSPLFRSPNLTFSAGDVWIYNSFNLGRRVPAFSKGRATMRSDLEATSGVNQTLFYYSRDTVRMTFTSLTDDQVQELQRWWGFAKDGGVFSAAIDDDECYLGKIAVDTVPDAATFTVNSGVGLNRREKLMLTKLNGQTFEVTEVLTVAGAVVTPKRKLLEGYPVGAQVRSSYYWPFVISVDQTFEPQLIDAKLKRWNCTISFKESL